MQYLSRSDTYNEMKLSPNANRSLLLWSRDMSRGQKLKFQIKALIWLLFKTKFGPLKWRLPS